jgi:hypothetical protein
MHTQPTTLANTALGRHPQTITIRQQVNNDITKMFWDEREESKMNPEKMKEIEEEKLSSFISAVNPNLDDRKSPSKPDEQHTRRIQK